jgi:ABC-type lipopolysaccharide export system ATPase subunit
VVQRDRAAAARSDDHVHRARHESGVPLAERITVLVGGKFLTEGTPAEIAADKRVKEVYLGEAQHG